MDWNVIVTGLTLLLAILGAQWKLYSSIDVKFSEVKKVVYQIKEDVLHKLEYHERHDDQRFAEMNDNIWMLRVRNAAKDGLITVKKDEEE